VNIKRALEIVTELASENVLTEQQAAENEAESDRAEQLEAVEYMGGISQFFQSTTWECGCGWINFDFKDECNDCGTHKDKQ
jgi:rubrerythrin